MAIKSMPLLKAIGLYKPKRRIYDDLYEPYKPEHREIYRKGVLIKRFENNAHREGSFLSLWKFIFFKRREICMGRPSQAYFLSSMIFSATNLPLFKAASSEGIPLLSPHR